MRVFALALVVCSLLVGCKKGSSANGDGGSPDLHAGVDGGPPDLIPQDLTMTDDAGPDLSGAGSDMDDHNALKIMPSAVPLKTDGGVDYYEMHVKEADQQVLPGNKTKIWGFDGIWPGPTVHATLGRPVTIKIFNDLPVNEKLSIHNHGHNVASAYDGHPSANVINQTASYEYKYPNMQGGGTAPNLQGAATYFFHDHVADLTAAHVYKGIAAFYLIHPMAGSTEAGLNLPSGAYDIPLMIADRTFNADNSLSSTANVVTGFQGQTMTVNGTVKPFLEVARRKYRFRLLNASPARRLNVGLSAGTMFQIASDGGLLPSPISPSRVLLGPAERADIVIDFSKYAIGDTVTLTNSDSFSPVIPEIMQFRVVRNETDTSTLPPVLDASFVRYKEVVGTDMAPAESVPPTTRTRSLSFTFDSAASMWKINGKTYNPSAYEFGTDSDTAQNTKLGDTEIWTLINADNASQIPHPFHQHLVEFQILDVCPTNNPTCGTPPVASQQGWKDTVLVMPLTIVRVKMNFYFNGPETPASVFPGDGYVFHCHTLEHEDHQMMLQQKVSP